MTFALVSRGFVLGVLALLVLGTGCTKLIRAKPAVSEEVVVRPQLAASATGINAERAAAPAAPVMPPITPSTVAPVAAPVALPLPTPANTQTAYRLRHGDPVVIYRRGILPKDDEVQVMVNEAGTIMMPFIDDVVAVGKTASELEREIQRIYIEREIYRTITINVIIPAQSVFVQGEVRAPQRYPLLPGMTIMQAIATAGGYTDFAERRRVTLSRGSEVREINMREIERDPSRDIMIESGDVIRVPRSFF
ncbi:MAG TPA: polysaccharide biosynthesis/export family protein [Kiritimatiellia bacterium]|nr:polysaccharide biosynthesis/export family protein [Kiritimatiellia bacterium]